MRQKKQSGQSKRFASSFWMFQGRAEDPIMSLQDLPCYHPHFTNVDEVGRGFWFRGVTVVTVDVVQLSCFVAFHLCLLVGIWHTRE